MGCWFRTEPHKDLGGQGLELEGLAQPGQCVGVDAFTQFVDRGLVLDGEGEVQLGLGAGSGDDGMGAADTGEGLDLRGERRRGATGVEGGGPQLSITVEPPGLGRWRGAGPGRAASADTAAR